MNQQAVLETLVRRESTDEVIAALKLASEEGAPFREEWEGVAVLHPDARYRSAAYWLLLELKGTFDFVVQGAYKDDSEGVRVAALAALLSKEDDARERILAAVPPIFRSRLVKDLATASAFIGIANRLTRAAKVTIGNIQPKRHRQRNPVR